MNNLLTHISENFSSLSKGHKKIATYVTENTDKAAFMTAGKLASAVGTSEATVIRFVSKLGFSGYAEFQKKMQEVLRGKLNNLQRMEVAFERIGNSDLLRNVMHSDVENIKQTLEHINKESLRYLFYCQINQVSCLRLQMLLQMQKTFTYSVSVHLPHWQAF